jgi:hypothetical protein
MHTKVATDEQALRPTDVNGGLMWHYAAGETVDTFSTPDSGFLVHFSRMGPNAVTAIDADDSGVPDIVESVNDVYGRVAVKYQLEMGYRAALGDGALPDNGGDGRFDVYLLNFGTGADGNFSVDQCPGNGDLCIGYIQQANDFSLFGYPNIITGTTVLGSHEYFHATQNAYSESQGVVIMEGTAVWAETQFDPTTNRADFNGFLSGYLSNPDRSLDSPPTGPVPAFAYGSAIFFQFLSEKFGPQIIRELWEHCEHGHGDPALPSDQATPHWMRQLDQLLQHSYGSSFAQAFREFATWNLFNGQTADAGVSYVDSAAYPKPAMTTETAPFMTGTALRVYYASTQYFLVHSTGRAQMAAVLDADTTGLMLVLATRRGGEIDSVTVPADVTASTPVDTSNSADLIVAVVNGAHEGSNGTLSVRPGLCIGSPDEIASCAGSGADGGIDAGMVPDAGAGGMDAGTDMDAGMQPPSPPTGCGCNAFPAPLLLAATLLLLGRRRDASPITNGAS